LVDDLAAGLVFVILRLNCRCHNGIPQIWRGWRREGMRKREAQSRPAG
jgi:hypothetical protein